MPAFRRLDEPARERLLRRYAEHGHPDDLEQLVLSYRPLAHALARRYTPGQLADADLDQAACEGLIKAIQRFDPARGIPFTSFALPTILGEVRRYLRDTAWCAHVPRALKERAHILSLTRERLTTETGRPPSAAQLAAALGWAQEDVVEALSAVAARSGLPYDVAAPADSEVASLIDHTGEVDPGYELVECATSVARALPFLPPEERDVIRLRFGDDLTQRQIAKRLGYSRSRVGRLLTRGLDRLRAEAA